MVVPVPQFFCQCIYFSTGGNLNGSAAIECAANGSSGYAKLFCYVINGNIFFSFHVGQGIRIKNKTFSKKNMQKYPKMCE